MRQVKFGVRLHQSGYSYESLREIWTEADRLGYYSATLYDLINAPALECWTTLSALADATQRIRLTPLVLANTYRHPALLAKMAATLDVISGGRLELGLGAGGGRGDHQASGIPFPPTRVRVAMLEEAIQLITRLWAEPQVDFQGSFYQLRGATLDPKPKQPRPPLLIGGHGETHMLRAVAKYADICNIGFEMNPEEYQAKLRVLAEYCREAGRDFSEIEVTHNTRVLVARTEAELEAQITCQAARSYQGPEAYRASLSRAIAGTPEQCVDQISQLVARGIAYFFLLFPEPVSVDDLRLFAEQVMPHFHSGVNN
ncbi:MAG: LLM class flavin-dependent oxidoreductase [Dehalococcoidia bacterium]